jgi:hypothetical protein
MLAKSTNAGSSFSGVINYFYEGKMGDRGKANKQAKVVCYSDNVRIPYGMDDTKTRVLLKQDFISQARMHRTFGNEENKKYVGQHILSFTQKDTKGMSPEKLKCITEDYVKMAGICQTQYVAFSHKDTSNFHVHILFNRVMNNGTKYPEWKEKKKTAERGIALSLGYKLELVGEMKMMAEAKEVTKLRAGMKDIVDLIQTNELLAHSKNLHHLGKLCEQRGVGFKEDEKLVWVGGESFSKLDLNAVFLNNRTERKEGIEQGKNLNEFGEKVIPKETKNLDFRSKDFEELNVGIMPIMTKDENTQLPRKKKRPADFKIKIGKIEKNMSTKKDLRI